MLSDTLWNTKTCWPSHDKTSRERANKVIRKYQIGTERAKQASKQIGTDTKITLSINKNPDLHMSNNTLGRDDVKPTQPSVIEPPSEVIETIGSARPRRSVYNTAQETINDALQITKIVSPTIHKRSQKIVIS
jgi:hypothetical protein